MELYDRLTPSPGSSGGKGGDAGKYCYHVAIFRDSNLFDMQHDHVLKKLNFDLLNLRSGGGEGCGKNNCYHVAIFRHF